MLCGSSEGREWLFAFLVEWKVCIIDSRAQYRTTARQLRNTGLERHTILTAQFIWSLQ